MSDAEKVKIEVYEKHDQAWEKYKMDHGKIYPSKYHEDERRKIWEHQVDFVNAHNKEYESGEKSWACGINQFSDGQGPAKNWVMTFHSLYGPVGETHYEKTDEAWEKYKSGQKFYTKYQEDDERKKWEDAIDSLNKK